METQKIKELVEWALTNYAFVAKGKGRITGKQLAELINEAFVCEPYEPHLRNQEEDVNFRAKDIIEKCVCYVTVRNDGEIISTYGTGNVTAKDLIVWGV